MSLPTLTPEQRAQALEKAAQARQLRAKLKEDIAAGKFKTWDDVQKDLAVRVKMRLAMPPSPDDPTTRPGL